MTGLHGILGPVLGLLLVTAPAAPLAQGQPPPDPFDAMRRMLEDLGQSGAPDSGRGAPSGDRAPPDPLGSLQDIFGPGTATPADPAAELALAETCTRRFEMPPMMEGPLRERLQQPFTGTETIGALNRIVDLMRVVASGDPCMLRDLLLMTATMDALGGRYAEGIHVLERLLPPLRGDSGLLEITGHAALAAVRMLQRRHEEAARDLDALRPLAARVLGPDSRVALAVEATGVDEILMRGESALAMDDVDTAEAAFRQALERNRTMGRRIVAAMGPSDEMACLVNATEAKLLRYLGRVEEAHAAYARLLEPALPCRRHLTPTNPLTARVLGALGEIEMGRGALEPADALLTEALAVLPRLRAANHPVATRLRHALAELRVLQGRPELALALVGEMDAGLMSWLGGELRDTSSRAQRRVIAALQDEHRQLAVRIALALPDDPAAQAAAATAVLRYKGLQGEEDAVLERIARRAPEGSETRVLVERIAALRSALATAFAAGQSSTAAVSGEEIETLSHQLAAAEVALARVSRRFEAQLAVRDVDVARIQEALGRLGPDATLVEYVEIDPREPGALRTLRPGRFWVAAVVTPSSVRVEKLAKAETIAIRLEELGTYGDDIDRTLYHFLHQRLVEPLRLPPEAPLIIAPEGALTMLAFHALRMADGRRWMGTRTGSTILTHSGRILSGDARAPRRAGLVVVGDVDYGPAEPGRRAFAPLGYAAEEARRVAEIAKAAGEELRAGLRGVEPTEAALAGIEIPPRILHLATHGFFGLEGDPEAANPAGPVGFPDRPAVLSGVALANANRPLRAVEDGILYAIEAQTLNLEGTELVALSACETALGVVERGEGVHGMVRAFRIAGASHALVALRAIDDREAMRFMTLFYEQWLSEAGTELPTAFSRTIDRIERERLAIDWTAYTLFRQR